MFYYYWYIIYFSINYKLKKSNLNFNLDNIKLSSLFLDSNLYNLNLIRLYSIYSYICNQYPKVLIGSFYNSSLKSKYIKINLSLRKKKLYKFICFFLCKLIFFLKKKNINLHKKKHIKNNYTFIIKKISNFFFCPAEFYNLSCNMIITFEFKKKNMIKNKFFLKSLNL